MLSFVPFTKQWLELTWDWLTDPDIKALTMAPDSTREEQERWFYSLGFRHDYLIWGVMFGDRHIGVVGLKNITEIEGEYWGYIGVKCLWGQGIGKDMQKFIVSVAKEKKLKRLYLIVNKNNTRAISCYKHFGFYILKEYSEPDMLKMTLNV